MAKKEEKALQKVNPTMSERFTSMVVREFGSTVGKLQLDPYQQRLAQHLFVAVDNALKTLEAKRLDQGGKGTPMVWSNINMEKLAIDAVHRIELGLDALIPGHVYPIPYYNRRLGKYDLDLRIGYVGKDYYRRKMAVEEPVDIIYELVHETDEFQPIKRSIENPIESFTFNVTNPFNRGKVIGGFGYIMYENPLKNSLVLVSKEDFDKSRAKAQSDQFWKQYEKEMQVKTLVHRVTSKLPVDPAKVNTSYMAVETDDAITENEREIDEYADQDFIDIESSVEKSEPKTKEKKQAPPPSQEPEQVEEENMDPQPPEQQREYIVCPVAKNPQTARRPVSFCDACPEKKKCDAYAEYLHDKEDTSAPSPGF